MELFNSIISEVKGFLPEGFRVYIAGGAIRDYLLGRSFKDIDVVILPPVDSGICETDVELVVSYLTNSEEHNNVQVIGFEDAYGGLSNTGEDTSDFQERILGCIKVELKGYPVDLLFQKGNETIEEVVKGYDHIANMVWWEGTYAKVSDTLFLDSLLYNFEGFNRTREIRECRVAKMTTIFEEHSKQIKQYLGIV